MTKHLLLNISMALLTIVFYSDTVNAQNRARSSAAQTAAKTPESIFYLKVSPGTIAVTFKNQLYKFRNMKKLDAFLKAHQVSTVVKEVTLDFGKKKQVNTAPTGCLKY